jgi:hypothetical protein
MHELLWTRRLVDLLGVAPGATLAQRLWTRVERPWRALRVVELAIAMATLPALTLPGWTDWLWPALGPDRVLGSPGRATKLLASVLVVMPPAVLIGMTLPLMGKAVLMGERRLGRHGTWLYAINSRGGSPACCWRRRSSCRRSVWRDRWASRSRSTSSSLRVPTLRAGEKRGDTLQSRAPRSPCRGRSWPFRRSREPGCSPSKSWR